MGKRRASYDEYKGIINHQQSSRFPPDGAVSSSFALSSGTGSQSTSEFTQSFSGSLPPLSAVRGLPEDQQPQQTFDIGKSPI